MATEVRDDAAEFGADAATAARPASAAPATGRSAANHPSADRRASSGRVGTDRPSHPLGRFAGRSAAGLVGVVLAALGLAAVLYLLSEVVVALDRTVVAGLNGVVAPHPALVGALQAVSLLGASLTGWVVLGTLALCVLIRRQYRLAAFVVVTGLGSTILGPAVKEIVGRARPIVDAPVTTAPGPSFPSGHALTATIVIGVLLLVLLPAAPPRVRRPLLAIGAVLVGAVGCSRIALGVHFPSDVVGGVAVGAGWLVVTACGLRSWRGHEGWPVPPVERGLEPEARAALVPAPHPGPARDSGWTVLARLVVAAVSLFGVVYGFGLLLTRVVPGSRFERADVAAAHWFVEWRTPTLDELSGPAAELGNTGVVFAGGLVAAVLTVAVWRCWRPALLLAVALVGEVAIFLVTAIVVGRPRPPVSHLDAALPPTSSFPSGHTGAAICLYGTMAALVLAAVRAWWRWLVLALAVALVGIVALARLYRGAHFPTDVLGSVLFALPWLLVTLRLLPPGPVRVSAPRRPSGAAWRARPK